MKIKAPQNIFPRTRIYEIPIHRVKEEKGAIDYPSKDRIQKKRSLFFPDRKKTKVKVVLSIMNRKYFLPRGKLKILRA